MSKAKVEYKTTGYYLRVNGTTVPGVFINVSNDGNALEKWGMTLPQLLTKLADADLEVIQTGTSSDANPF